MDVLAVVRCCSARRSCSDSGLDTLNMGSLTIWHWIIVVVVVLVLFGGRGRISQRMGDFAQGIRAFKEGMQQPEQFRDRIPGSAFPESNRSSGFWLWLAIAILALLVLVTASVKFGWPV